MLPLPDSKDFPRALKEARLAKGLSRAALAKLAGIHPVMPRRYEEPECGEFARPSASTYQALLSVFTAEGQPSVTDTCVVSLQDASIDEIISELKSRGATVSLHFPVNGGDAVDAPFPNTSGVNK